MITRTGQAVSESATTKYHRRCWIPPTLQGIGKIHPLCMKGGKARMEIRSQALHGEDISSSSMEKANTVPPERMQTRMASMEADSTVQLYFSTGWRQAYLHYSICGGEWGDLPFVKVGASNGWHRASFEVEGNSNGSNLLEFVITNNEGAWDKPLSVFAEIPSCWTGGNYSVDLPGTYVVEKGDIKSVHGKPMMIVSDLDGTMIGDDGATKAFQDFWQQKALVRGSTLVYNSGRSLDSFMKLLEEKSNCLNTPDVFISSVGTQIYLNDGHGNWKEDKGWTSTLDKDWNLNIVREAAYFVLATVGKDSMHFRPPEEQNDYKVTCGVAFSVLEKVVSDLESALKKQGVKARIISSGLGEWRFLDIVSHQAGKLEALEHVRKSHGFDKDATIACGDSGNDILMLAGENPAIVVGNAQPDLIEWVKSQEPNTDSQSRLFVSAKNEAYGILDGIKHFGYET